MSDEKPKRLNETPLEIIPIELLGLDNDEETGVYDNIEIEDMEFDDDLSVRSLALFCLVTHDYAF